jgi:large subunit ribosomal protein L33
MAKKSKKCELVRLMSPTGKFFYVRKKNPKKVEKLELRKYDPKERKHLLFRESKMK